MFRFEARSGGADISLDVSTNALTLMARLMAPIGKLMMGKVMRKCMEDDLEDLKRLAESQAGATAS